MSDFPEPGRACGAVRAQRLGRPAGLLVVLALMLPTAALAQAASSAALTTAPYPTKPITLVVGSAAGGSNDVFARAIGKRLQDALGQPVVVDNKPSGGGIIANAAVARAPADGYTLVVVSSTFTTGAALRTNLSYDAVKDFKPVALLAKGPLLVTVRQESPLRSIQELVAAAKAQPGKLNYGTSGAGSINHFATELMSDAAGIRMTHVPYKGMGPATNDLLGGQCAFDTVAGAQWTGARAGGHDRVTFAGGARTGVAGRGRLQGQRPRFMVGRAGTRRHATAGGRPAQC